MSLLHVVLMDVVYRLDFKITQAFLPVFPEIFSIAHY